MLALCELHNYAEVGRLYQKLLAVFSLIRSFIHYFCQVVPMPGLPRGCINLAKFDVGPVVSTGATGLLLI